MQRRASVNIAVSEPSYTDQSHGVKDDGHRKQDERGSVPSYGVESVGRFCLGKKRLQLAETDFSYLI